MSLAACQLLPCNPHDFSLCPHDYGGFRPLFGVQLLSVKSCWGWLLVKLLFKKYPPLYSSSLKYSPFFWRGWVRRDNTGDHPSRTSCLSDVQKTVVKCNFSRGRADLHALRDPRMLKTVVSKVTIFVCRGLPRVSLASFIHFCAQDCSERKFLIYIQRDEPSRGFVFLGCSKLW